MKEIYWVIIGMIALNILVWGIVRLHKKEMKNIQGIHRVLDNLEKVQRETLEMLDGRARK